MKLSQLILCTDISCDEVFSDREYPDFRCPRCGSSGIRLVSFFVKNSNNHKKELGRCQKPYIAHSVGSSLQ